MKDYLGILMEKYGGLTDARLREGYSGWDLDGVVAHKIRRIAEMGITEEYLLGFWAEIKDLSWPASYGQSPWETAGTLAYGIYMRANNKPVGAFHAGYLVQFLSSHPAYQSLVKLRGYSRETTAAHAVTPQDGARILVRAMPEWSQRDHARLAVLHHEAAKFNQKKWSGVAESAAMSAFGRPYQISDYRMSAVANELFSDAEKAQLRMYAHAEARHLALAAAHNYASRMRSVPGDSVCGQPNTPSPPAWMRRLKEAYYWNANSLAGLSMDEGSPYVADDVIWRERCDSVAMHSHLAWLLKNEISVGPVANRWDAIQIFEDEEEGCAPSMQ